MLLYPFDLCHTCMHIGLMCTNIVDIERQHLQSDCRWMKGCYIHSQLVLTLIPHILRYPNVLLQFLGQSKQKCRRLILQNASSWSNYIIITVAQKTHYLPYELQPNCLHTILASVDDQKSSVTVPHIPLRHTSTRPSSCD